MKTKVFRFHLHILLSAGLVIIIIIILIYFSQAWINPQLRGCGLVVLSSSRAKPHPPFFAVLRIRLFHTEWYSVTFYHILPRQLWSSRLSCPITIYFHRPHLCNTAVTPLYVAQPAYPASLKNLPDVSNTEFTENSFRADLILRFDSTNPSHHGSIISLKPVYCISWCSPCLCAVEHHTPYTGWVYPPTCVQWQMSIC